MSKFIPADAKCVVVEAAVSMGWGDVVRNELMRIDLNDFGKSAPAEVLAEYYGFTAKKIAAKIKNWLK